MSFSPTKDSQNAMSKYAHGKISDGKKSLPFVCFNEKILDDIRQYQKSKSPVKLHNVAIKTFNNNLQIHVGSASSLEESSKPFGKIVIPPTTSLASVDATGEYTVKFDVLHVGSKRRVGSQNSINQHITIHDESANMVLSLWETHCEKFTEGNSYHVTDVYLNDMNYISLSAYSQISEQQAPIPTGEICAVNLEISKLCSFCDTNISEDPCGNDDTILWPIAWRIYGQPSHL